MTHEKMNTPYDRKKSQGVFVYRIELYVGDTNIALDYAIKHNKVIIMIVVSRNAQKRSDKPLQKWLWQN